MIYLQLFFAFFKTGLFAVGGGMATLPFLYEISEQYGWFSHAQLLDMIAVSESTPGPIGVNMATYVGYTTCGVAGAVLATLGLVLPSFLIILLITRALKAFGSNPYVLSAFYGLRPASTGLIAAAGVSVLSVALLHIDTYVQTKQLADLFNPKAILLAAAILILTNFVKPTKKLHPILLIVLSALVGIVFQM